MDVTQTAKDAAYITVGLGVIAFQKAQVLRHDVTTTLTADRAKFEADAKARATELRTAVDAQVTEAKTELAKLVAKVDAAFEPVTKELETRLNEVEARLPEPVKGYVAQARTQAKETEAQVRQLLAV